MSGIPFWQPVGGQSGQTFMDTPWDILFVEGTGAPGITECSGAPERKADKQSPAGKNGGAPVLHGRKPATFETTTRIWTPDQWDTWQGIQEAFWPKGGAGTVQAVDLYHPYLSGLGIRSGIAQSVTGPIVVNGVGTMKVKWLEFVKGGKKSATKRPAGSQVSVRQEFVPGSSGQVAADGTPIRQPENQTSFSLPSEQASFVGP